MLPSDKIPTQSENALPRIPEQISRVSITTNTEAQQSNNQFIDMSIGMLGVNGNSNGAIINEIKNYNNIVSPYEQKIKMLIEQITTSTPHNDETGWILCEKEHFEHLNPDKNGWENEETTKFIFGLKTDGTFTCRKISDDRYYRYNQGEQPIFNKTDENMVCTMEEIMLEMDYSGTERWTYTGADHFHNGSYIHYWDSCSQWQRNGQYSFNGLQCNSANKGAALYFRLLEIAHGTVEKTYLVQHQGSIPIKTNSSNNSTGKLDADKISLSTRIRVEAFKYKRLTSLAAIICTVTIFTLIFGLSIFSILFGFAAGIILIYYKGYDIERIIKRKANYDVTISGNIELKNFPYGFSREAKNICAENGIKCKEEIRYISEGRFRIDFEKASDITFNYQGGQLVSIFVFNFPLNNEVALRALLNDVCKLIKKSIIGEIRIDAKKNRKPWEL